MILPDLLLHPERQREQAVYTGGELLNEAGTEHELMADGIGISRDFPLGTAEKTRETHCFPPGGSLGLGRGSRTPQRAMLALVQAHHSSSSPSFTTTPPAARTGGSAGRCGLQGGTLWSAQRCEGGGDTRAAQSDENRWCGSGTPNMTIPLLLDTDIGDDVDDAFALLLAARPPAIELLGVTTVYGPVQERALITRKLLDTAGRSDVPVAVGEGITLAGRDPGRVLTSGQGYVDLTEWERLAGRAAPTARRGFPDRDGALSPGAAGARGHRSADQRRRRPAPRTALGRAPAVADPHGRTSR